MRERVNEKDIDRATSREHCNRQHLTDFLFLFESVFLNLFFFFFFITALKKGV